VSDIFNMELRAQQEWSWLLAIWLFLGGTGSGLFLLYMIFGLPVFFGALALGCILCGGVVLLLELGTPLRAWRTIFRAGTSWLSRGVIFVVLFIGTCALSIGPKLGIFAWPAGLDGGTVEQVLGWIAALCAVMITLYPAFFFLSTSQAIPFWNTPFLPLLFVGYGVLGGEGAVLLVSSYLGSVPAQMGPLGIILIVLNALLLAGYLLAVDRSSDAVKESIRMLNRAPLSFVFWVGAVVIGLVLPLLAILFVPAAVPAAGACILVGGLLLRYSLLKAGVYVPPALVHCVPDLSKLNRTSSEFEREYARMPAQPSRGR
jgi:formate-dependent nitrite reductase membrane component NrfD